MTTADHPQAADLKATTHQPGEHPDRQLQFLQELVAEHATISGDIIEVGTHSWAIHGSIAVDGEVIMAEYDTPDQARRVLSKLSSADHGTAAPWRLNQAEDTEQWHRSDPSPAYPTRSSAHDPQRSPLP